MKEMAILGLLLWYFSAFAQTRECSATVAVGSCDQLRKAPSNANGAKSIDMPQFQDGSAIYNEFSGGEAGGGAKDAVESFALFE